MRGFIGISAKLIWYNKRLARITSLIPRETKKHTRTFYNTLNYQKDNVTLQNTHAAPHTF